MLKQLRKKLLFLFTCSVMLVVTVVFCILIHSNIESGKNSEREIFNRTATYVLFDINNGKNTASNFSLYETTYPIAFQYINETGKKQYQTSSDSFSDVPGIMAAFKNKIENTEATDSLSDSAYTQSGIFSFEYKNKAYLGIYCDIARKNGQVSTLYLVRHDTPVTSFIKENFFLYLFIWITAFFTILLICRFLIAKATHPTEAAIQSQKNFIAAASHELKAPLAVILTNAEAAAADPALGKHLLKNMNAIDTECLRMSTLVQDLLLLSSIDAGMRALNMSDIDLYTLLLTIYEKFEPVCKKSNIHLNLDISDDIVPKFSADKNRLEQILCIFLDNAVHYSKPVSSISLTVSTAAKHMIFTVQDHGIGIKDSDKPFIYDRFYQADQSRTHSQHYGLGLSIAKELVELHKGKIKLFDTPGGGCTFKIYFPIF